MFFYAMYIISNNVNSNHYNALTVIVFIIIINIYTYAYIFNVCCNKPLSGKAAGSNRQQRPHPIKDLLEAC